MNCSDLINEVQDHIHSPHPQDDEKTQVLLRQVRQYVEELQMLEAILQSVHGQMTLREVGQYWPQYPS
ncbi:MAG TPA: hypothetical protein VLB90_03725 [Pseudomonadales bacterium]|nr:hypothetical protein [Pseudomonadales bacterium]